MTAHLGCITALILGCWIAYVIGRNEGLKEGFKRWKCIVDEEGWPPMPEPLPRPPRPPEPR